MMVTLVFQMADKSSEAIAADYNPQTSRVEALPYPLAPSKVEPVSAHIEFPSGERKPVCSKCRKYAMVEIGDASYCPQHC